MDDKIYNELTGDFYNKKKQAAKDERKNTYDVFMQFDDDEPILAFPYIAYEDAIILEVNALPKDENGRKKDKVVFIDKKTGKKFSMFIKTYKDEKEGENEH